MCEGPGRGSGPRGEHRGLDGAGAGTRSLLEQRDEGWDMARTSAPGRVFNVFEPALLTGNAFDIVCRADKVYTKSSRGFRSSV